ncbi:hypothetical protein TNCV_3890461 [Trichonephila clavipes]|nr:hypothetical protein TNCV_3890461 [Trichonephila clavipes]
MLKIAQCSMFIGMVSDAVAGMLSLLSLLKRAFCVRPVAGPRPPSYGWRSGSWEAEHDRGSSYSLNSHQTMRARNLYHLSYGDGIVKLHQRILNPDNSALLTTLFLENST